MCPSKRRPQRVREPRQLRRGKRFHQLIQTEWVRDVTDPVKAEARVRKPSGRPGRVDVFVRDAGRDVSVVEVKSTNWDRLVDAAAKRTARRQAKQVWEYIRSQLRVGRNVSPGIIFPKRPKSGSRRRLVESLFENEGIAVVWHSD